MKNYRYYGILFVLACVALTGCGKKSTAVEKKPIEVKVLTVEKSEVGSRQSFSGTIEEMNGSTLSFPIMGTVKSIAVTQGQRVAKGQLIATLDDATFRHTLDVSAATLEQARDAYDRMKQLHDSNSLPEIKWVEVESKLKQAQSAYEIAKKNLVDTKLYAPFAGYISEKSAEVGTNVMPGVPTVKLVTLDNVKVGIAVPETEVSNVRLGEPVEIVVPALDNRRFEGVIQEKGVAANSLSRSYLVKAVIKNPSNELLPGMLCTLYLTPAEAKSSAILLPRHVVQLASDNRQFVWLDNNGRAERCFITTDGFVGDKIAVASGLPTGAKVVVEGQQKISDNMALSVIQ
jgi:RND family efflux transporter MFP subunit